MTQTADDVIAAYTDCEIATLNADIVRLRAYIHRLEYPEPEVEP